MTSAKDKSPIESTSASDAPWLRDPPKRSAESAASPDLEAELSKLERDIADEGNVAEKAPPKIIAAGGLDEAKAYIAPTTPATHIEPPTIEVHRVQIAKGVDPRNAVTQEIDRSTALRAAEPRAPGRRVVLLMLMVAGFILFAALWWLRGAEPSALNPPTTTPSPSSSSPAPTPSPLPSPSLSPPPASAASQQAPVTPPTASTRPSEPPPGSKRGGARTKTGTPPELFD